jgi:hypothetical protein
VSGCETFQIYQCKCRRRFALALVTHQDAEYHRSIFQLLHSSLLPIDYTAACDTTSTCTTRSPTLCSTNIHRAHHMSLQVCHEPPIDEEAPTADAGPSTTTVWMPAATLTYQHALSASSAPQYRRTQTNDACLHSTTEADRVLSMLTTLSLGGSILILQPSETP